MTIQYNVPIKVLDTSQTWLIQKELANYRIFTDRSGNLDGTCFSMEEVPYVGKLIVIKTLKKEAARIAHEVLTGIEGLLVMPITESDLEEDKKRVAKIRRERLSA